jgi:hypothetical protein
LFLFSGGGQNGEDLLLKVTVFFVRIREQCREELILNITVYFEGLAAGNIERK